MFRAKCILPIGFPEVIIWWMVIMQIMASSLNGLTVGDPLPENLMDSPARSESMFYLRYYLFLLSTCYLM